MIQTAAFEGERSMAIRGDKKAVYLCALILAGLVWLVGLLKQTGRS